MKTPIILAVIAVVTGALAWWPASDGASKAEERRAVLGAPDAKPEQVASLRVATWENGSAKVFEVAKKEGAWVIPSQHDYPADGGTRVGRTAGGVLGVTPGRLVGSDPQDHKELGVLDPLSDQPLGDEGRGKRVTVKDLSGATLVDLIIGKPVTGGEGTFVRLADSNEVWTAKVEADISTKFIDWVEPDLLKIARDDIRQVVFRDFSLDETGQRIVAQSRAFSREGSTADWTSPETPADQRVAKTALDTVLGELTNLRLVGIRPLNPLWLEPRGFLLVGDQALLQDPNSLSLSTGRGRAVLVGTKGGVTVATKDGVRYQCFFGEIAVEDDADTQAEVKPAERPESEEGHNRYMVVFVTYDPAADEDAKKAAEQPKEEGAKPKDPAGKAKADKAQRKFGQFFYVVSGKSYGDLRPKAESLFEAKPPEPTVGDTGKTISQWLADNGAREGVKTTASGLQYEVLTASDRADAKTPGPNDPVHVRYKGTLVDGTEFDATTGDETRSFTAGGVIKGWGEALQLMKEGDKWRLTIPPAIGYGEAGSPPKIGPNQILIFEVELVRVGE